MSAYHRASDTSPIDPAKWVADYGDVLFRYAQARLGDRQTAEDVVQETLLAALQARRHFAGRASEQTWLVAILRRKIADHYRKNARERTSESGCSNSQASDDFDSRGHWRSGPRPWSLDPAEVAEDREFWQVFDGCVSKLPDSLAAVYRLREGDDLPTEEICEVLGISASNLWTQLYRARMRLRDCLEKNWFHHSES